VQRFVANTLAAGVAAQVTRRTDRLVEGGESTGAWVRGSGPAGSFQQRLGDKVGTVRVFVGAGGAGGGVCVYYCCACGSAERQRDAQAADGQTERLRLRLRRAVVPSSCVCEVLSPHPTPTPSVWLSVG
jgi:hypothetical protein